MDDGAMKLYDGRIAGHSRFRICPGCKKEMGYGHTAKDKDGKWYHTCCLLRKITGNPDLFDLKAEREYEKDNRKW